jgi:hypothetical protein
LFSFALFFIYIKFLFSFTNTVFKIFNSVSFEQLDLTSQDHFWQSLGDALSRRLPEQLKTSIRSANDFLNAFVKHKWKYQTVLFFDEFDQLYDAADDVCDSFLTTFRSIKSCDDFNILAVVVIGTFSILQLDTHKQHTSPFNVKEPIKNQSLGLEHVRELFDEFKQDRELSIDAAIVEDIYTLTNGYVY